MFNVYEYDKRYQTLQIAEKKAERSVKRAKVMRVKNQEMREKYKDRITGFI